jgi:integrase
MQRLKGSDFDFERGLLYVAPMKRQPAVRKVICPVAHMFLKRIREGGLTSCRRGRFAVMNGELTFLDEFTWIDGHLFLSKNSTARGEHMNYHAAFRAIGRARASFKHLGVADVQSIRTHSSRHHAIHNMKSSGLGMDAGMAHARIKSQRVYMGYGARPDYELRAEYIHNESLLAQNQRAYGAVARAAGAAGADEKCVSVQSGSCSNGAASAALPAEVGAAGARERRSWTLV